ncbi:MAG: hypothetical protein NUV59_00135, partial [Patescibacteria group bacterium]|nr:hypothetical protein [Patescibacteria group bacterium]
MHGLWRRDNRAHLQRGVSILAGVVFIAILGIVGLFLQATVAPSDPLAQSASASLAALTTESVEPKDTSWDTGRSVSTSQNNPALQQAINLAAEKKKACGNAKSQALSLGADSWPTSGNPKPQKFEPGQDAIKDDKCVGAVALGPDRKTIEDYRCVGESSTINFDARGGGTIVSSADSRMPEGKCFVTYCDGDGKNCSPALTIDGASDLKKIATSNPYVLSKLSKVVQQNLVKAGALPDAATRNLTDAYNKVGDAGKAVDDVRKSCAANTSCVASIDKQIAQAAGLTCSNPVESALTCDVVADPDTVGALQKTQKDLQGSLAYLKDAQAGPGCTGPNCSAPQPTPRPDTNAPRPPPNNDPTPGPPGGGNSTFGPRPTGSAGGNVGGLIGPLLSGLLKGLMGQQSGQGQKPPAPACSTDSQAYAQQQQQYQQAMQQYNYQLQQYNYQRQLDSYYGNQNSPPEPPPQPQHCKPSTGSQCTSSPRQPPAANCNVGSWRAVYQGACIADWQCVPASATTTPPVATTTQPTPPAIPEAKLSCQPTIADVGMDIAISYSCTAGTAEGDGFSATSTAGSATTTIQKPPAGANTATYGVKCTTNEGRTAGAQCSIEINQPSIIFIANP